MPHKLTNEEFVHKLHDVNPNIKPLDEYKLAREKIRFECLLDGTVFSSTPNNALRGHGCPLCGMKKGTKNAVNTKTKKSPETLLINKRPNLCKCLKNKEDAYKYGYTSRKLLNWLCPDCGFEIAKAPGSFLSDHFVCSNCIKNDSYPNRFMFNILTQMNIDFEREYSPDWISPKRYDFYVGSKNIIIEMDGGFHREKSVQENDLYKDIMAASHHLQVIRINCNYGKTEQRYNIIKNNINKSTLSKFFNFTNIDWEEANAFALKNEVAHVCELWNKYHDLDKISDETQLILYTVKKYLNFAADNNMSDYDHEKCMEDRKMQRIKDGRFARSVGVICNETGEYFSNMREANKKYHCNVSSYFYQNRHYAGILPDGTKLTWRKVNKNSKIIPNNQINISEEVS